MTYGLDYSIFKGSDTMDFVRRDSESFGILA